MGTGAPMAGFHGRCVRRFGVYLLLILFLTGVSSCNGQHIDNCTDLVLTDGTLVINTDCGVWYLICDDNMTSCLPYDVTDSENGTFTCAYYMDLDLELNLFEDEGSGGDTTPWLSSTQTTIYAASSTSEGSESSMTSPSTGTPETTVQPENTGSTTPYATTPFQSTGTQGTDGASSPSGTQTPNYESTTTGHAEGTTPIPGENVTEVETVTDIVGTDTTTTLDETTTDPESEQSESESESECDRLFNSSGNQHIVLRGSVTHHNYTDDFNRTWHYGVATFNINGSLYLGPSLTVEVQGENALRVNDTFGDVIINTTIKLDRLNSSSFTVRHLGGFGSASGPGGAAPNSSDGAGHGGMGGAINTSTLYSHAYLLNDTEHIIGGSAGGTSWNCTGVEHAYGGGGIEIIAADLIYIDSEIITAGENAIQFNPEGQHCCNGGGSGGLIRLIAQMIHIGDAGLLNVEGGNGSLADNGTTSCGGGGAGGVVQLLANESCLFMDAVKVQGGVGFNNGDQGSVTISGSQCSIREGESTNGNSGKGNGNGGNGNGGNGNGNDGNGAGNQVSSSSGSSSSPVTSEEIVSTLMTPRLNTTPRDDTVSTTPTTALATSVLTTSASTHTTSATSHITSATTHTTSPTPTPNNTVVEQEIAKLISSFSMSSSVGNSSSNTNISSSEAATQLKDLENAVSNVALNLLQGLADDELLKTTISVGDTAVAIEIVPVADFEGSSFPSGDSNSSDTTITIPTVVLPENATGHLVSVFILHTRPPPLGGNLVDNNRSDVRFELNSQVISASVSLADDSDIAFNEPIRIVLRNSQEDETGNSSHCVFYDFSAENNTGAWSTEGCRVSNTNATHVTCSCDHLTNFAILLQINDIEISEKDQLILQIISQVGIGLSLIFLTIGFIIIAASLKSLHNREAAIIHLNLMAAMIIGHLIFIIGIDDVYSQKRCKAVAMLLHFFYLVTFVWMLMEGVHIYFRATRVFKNTSYQLKIFHAISYGAPFFIVMVTALVNIDFYGTSQACWLSRERGAIWAFAGPVLTIIGINIIILVIVLQTFLTIKSINNKSKFEQAKRSTRAAVVLLPLLGITWVFGFLATGSATIFFQYAFALLNSLQGVFICLFHCFMNDDVMKVMKLKYKRSKQQFDAISSHHSMIDRLRSTTNTNKISIVGRKEAFVEKSKMSTTTTDTSVF